MTGSLMTTIGLSLHLFASTPGGFLSEAIHEMTLMDWVNAVVYHRSLGKIVDAVRFAHVESNRLFPNDPYRPNGKGNAFKHAVWSAVMSSEIGSGAARRISNGHEDWPKNPPLEKAMDLHNNAIGNAVGDRLPGGKRSEIEDAILRELKNGKLRYIKAGRLIPTNE